MVNRSVVLAVGALGTLDAQLRRNVHSANSLFLRRTVCISNAAYWYTYHTFRGLFLAHRLALQNG